MWLAERKSNRELKGILKFEGFLVTFQYLKNAAVWRVLWNSQWSSRFLLPTIIDKIFSKNWENQQNWARPENIDICFCENFDRYWQILIFGEGTISLTTQSWDFLFISSLRSQSRKYYRNLWGNSHTEFTILDIKYRFTCGKLNFH